MLSPRRKMKNYRVILTFPAPDAKRAAVMVACPELLPRETRMRVADVDRGRTIRLALVLGLTIAFWLTVAIGVIEAWRRIPS